MNDVGRDEPGWIDFVINQIPIPTTGTFEGEYENNEIDEPEQISSPNSPNTPFTPPTYTFEPNSMEVADYTSSSDSSAKPFDHTPIRGFRPLDNKLEEDVKLMARIPLNGPRSSYNNLNSENTWSANLQTHSLMVQMIMCYHHAGQIELSVCWNHDDIEHGSANDLGKENKFTCVKVDSITIIVEVLDCLEYLDLVIKYKEMFNIGFDNMLVWFYNEHLKFVNEKEIPPVIDGKQGDVVKPMQEGTENFQGQFKNYRNSEVDGDIVWVTRKEKYKSSKVASEAEFGSCGKRLLATTLRIETLDSDVVMAAIDILDKG
ncbi:hypothetical protein E3N88_09629 [Mikania micrantha]|uniref:Uncharacterized protein n=1 Tax=Mikania micrantha TaxID=192012 RepID=A0A5N6PLV8_9ASTR|nr:hypothetical protein E3N88_09629 [Mikania micrantha]